MNATDKSRIENDYRIPVNDWSRRCFFIAMMDLQSDLPSVEDLKKLSSYIEFETKTLYNDPDRILKLALPGDPGHNTLTFQYKIATGWRYRRATWTVHGYTPTNIAQYYTLNEILDLAESSGIKKWNTWKETHSEIFG